MQLGIGLGIWRRWRRGGPSPASTWQLNGGGGFWQLNGGGGFWEMNR